MPVSREPTLTEQAAVLVVNCGSSSIKIALIMMDSGQRMATGQAERLGQADAVLHWFSEGKREEVMLADSCYDAVLQQMLELVSQRFGSQIITAVGHRIVHGGERFVSPALLNDEVIYQIELLSHLAPLHNPVNLLGIKNAREQFPAVPHVAVFDTAFHHSMPLRASLYAVPYHWYQDYGVRRYGFHGISHHYVAQEAARRLGREMQDCQLLTAHLGNGCSATAVRNGISVDTTMGFTPLEGLMMGTRSGDIDPGLHAFISKQTGADVEEITRTLNYESGLLGISGLSYDMRTLLDAAKAGNERAVLAVDMFCYRLAKALAALAVALDEVHALVFTGGIGEHADIVRMQTCRHLSSIGIKLDAERNRQHGRGSDGAIGKDESPVSVLVIATNEEWMIAKYVCAILDKKKDSEYYNRTITESDHPDLTDKETTILDEALDVALPPSSQRT